MLNKSLDPEFSDEEYLEMMVGSMADFEAEFEEEQRRESENNG